MAKQPMKKATAKKTSTRPKAKPGKDYMKPVGGTKQPGYKAPGSELRRKDSRDTPSRTIKGGYQVGKSATDRLSTLQQFGPKGINQVSQYLKTGINPTAMKATSGNPKPTTAQLAAGKKASDAAKTRAAAKAKAKAAADKAAKEKDAKTAKKPTTGVYKRGNP